MAGGFFPPQTDEELLVNRLLEAERRLDELERPTGTQLAEIVSKISTPITGAASSTSISFPVTVSVALTVPVGCTQAFYIHTAVMNTQATTAFQCDLYVSAPTLGSGTVAAAGASPFTGGTTNVATGTLTGLTPGDTLTFSSVTGSVRSGTITASKTAGSVLAVFRP